jgi:hypothetical protein
MSEKRLCYIQLFFFFPPFFARGNSPLNSFSFLYSCVILIVSNHDGASW